MRRRPCERSERLWRVGLSLNSIRLILLSFRHLICRLNVKPSEASGIVYPASARRTHMLMIVILGFILVASLAGAGLIASAQTAQNEASEAFLVSSTEAN